MEQEQEQEPRRIAVELLDRRTFQNYLRILGWLNGVWRKSHDLTKFYDWDPAAFSRATGRKGGKRIEVRTLERVFPKFQVWCQEYYFTRINVGGRWCIRITRNPYVHAAMPGAHVHDRLVARIRKHLALAGQIKVDVEWCRKFSEISRLSINQVEHAWLKLKKIDGVKHKWRGQGRGRKYCAELPERWTQICADRAARKATARAEKSKNLASSDPQTSHPVSIYFVNDKIKTSGPSARSPEGSARTASAKAPPPGGADRVGKSEAEPGGCETPGIQPYLGRWFPGRKPLQICNRLISPQNLLRKAAWLAVARLKFAHVACDRVHFAFPHARNFALAALRFGYRDTAIETAWRTGVARSHQDALDADRLPGGGYASTRPPSAAKVYAWQALRAADPRPPEMLWSEFLNTPRTADERAPSVSKVAKVPRAKKPAASPELASAAAAPRLSRAEAVEQLEHLRGVVKRVPAETAARRDEDPDLAGLRFTLGELKAALEPRGLTIAKFNALSWPMKKGIVAAAIAARKKS